ncbi:MAG: RNA polymerase factor sigma-54, partial [Betaproteobacteria bacterium]|nr:RNA polymerase factor sigma-54 [Betaproteobacteria bacterium]MBV9362555.1 RNA polymerase factor sigma-54 [Betaproteobacteria bacterium]
MKPSLQFRLSQHLTLTPQLQQSIRLLQLSTVELNQEIDRLLMENPALEREDGGEDVEGAGEAPPPPAAGGTTSTPTEAAPAPDAASDADWATDLASNWRTNESGDEEGEKSFTPPDTPTLRDHLHAQLSLTKLSPRDRAFVELLIDALDEDGYLTQPLEEIAALLAPEAEADPEFPMGELSIALAHLQHFDPAGVGARSPGECLALQLRNHAECAERTLALEIVNKHLELLAARDYSRLKTLTGADDNALRTAQNLIRALNPRPGAAFAKVEARYVVPDVIVKKVRNAWRASLNPDAMPRLRINRLYAEIAAGARSAGSLSTQLQEARWLIKNVQQRFETILRVSQAIVDRQRHFLEHGEVAMRPLVLREIAETLSLHESTISRVTTQKYMATPRGTFELKYFFGSHVATEAGGAASSTAIRALIKQLVAAEDAKAPLSDARIAQ